MKYSAPIPGEIMSLLLLKIIFSNTIKDFQPNLVYLIEEVSQVCSNDGQFSTTKGDNFGNVKILY